MFAMGVELESEHMRDTVVLQLAVALLQALQYEKLRHLINFCSLLIVGAMQFVVWN